MSDKSTRYNVRKHAVALIDASPRNVLTPALDLGVSVRDLTDPQVRALLALLETFEEHPRFRTPDRYLAATLNHVAYGDPV
jgi:hypothetical protein